MKKLFSIVTVLVMVLVLTACSKDVSGEYAAFDKEIGQVDLNISEETATMTFTTMNKAAEIASSGLFAPKVDTSMFKLNGKIDMKENKMVLKTDQGEKIDATYEVKDDVLIINVKNMKSGIKFYKVDSKAYTNQSSKFNEDEVLNNISL